MDEDTKNKIEALRMTLLSAQAIDCERLTVRTVDLAAVLAEIDRLTAGQSGPTEQP